MLRPPFESKIVMLSKTMLYMSSSVLLPNLMACDLLRMIVFDTKRSRRGPRPCELLGQTPSSA